MRRNGCAAISKWMQRQSGPHSEDCAVTRELPYWRNVTEIPRYYSDAISAYYASSWDYRAFASQRPECHDLPETIDQLFA